MFTERHHYLASSPKVAKLFASKNKPVTENEAMYRALNQSLNALVYLRGRESLIPEIQSGHIPSLVAVEMPVIVCNSFADFYGIDMDSPATQPVDENFQLEVNYAYLDLHGIRWEEYFLIDVVDFDRLDTRLLRLTELRLLFCPYYSQGVLLGAHTLRPARSGQPVPL